MLLFEGVYKTFSSGDKRVEALEDINMQVEQSEFAVIVGPSGCGKSTLGRVILQLYRQTSGACEYFGKSLEEVRPRYYAREIKRLPRYQKKARRCYRRSLLLDGKAAQARHHMSENEAQASSREARHYARWARVADRLDFRARELRKEASRQLREGSRTVGSLILSRDLDRVQALYRRALDELKTAHTARKKLLRLGRLAPAYLPPGEEDLPHHKEAANIAKQAMDMLKTAGAPYHPEHLKVDMERFRDTHFKAQMIRPRYTVLDVLTDLGIFEDTVDKLFADDGFWGQNRHPETDA